MRSDNLSFPASGRSRFSYFIDEPARHNANGFTLFEMLIVMGIVGILFAIAMPSYRYVTNANRIAAEVNGLLGDLQFARSEAIKNGLPVTVCAAITTPGGTGCSNGTAWNVGWATFSGVYSTAVVYPLTIPTNTLLRVQKQFTGTDTFTASGFISYVSFNREGFASGPSGFVTSGTMISLDPVPASSANTRCLSISLIGMMQVVPYDGYTCT